MKRIGMRVYAAAILVGALVFPVHVWGQEPDLTPWVVVIPAANNAGGSSLDAVGETVAETIDLSLRLLGEFDVRSVPPERIPPEVIAGDPDALAEFAEAETIDYIVFGSVATNDDEQIVIEAAVWDRGAGRITVEETRTAVSLFDTFNVADELAITFLSAFSGQRIAFGSITLQAGGWPDASFEVSVDGTVVGRNTTRVDNVLIGARTIEVRALNGPQAGEVVQSVAVDIAEGANQIVAFSISAPPVVGSVQEPAATEAEPAVEPESTVDAEPAVEPESEAEPQPASEADPEAVADDTDAGDNQPTAEATANPRPWTRNNRSAPGRRPIVAAGFATHSVAMPTNNGRTYLTPYFLPAIASVAVDFGGGLYAAGEIGGMIHRESALDGATTFATDEEFAAYVAAGGEVDAIVSSRSGVRVSVGYRVWETELGPFRVDVTPVGRVGLDEYVVGFYADDRLISLETADGVSDASAGQTVLGGGVVSRVHVRRWSLVIQAYAEANIGTGLSEVEEGDPLYATGEPETSVATVGTVEPGFSSGLSIGASIGVSFSMGGRGRR